MTTHDTHTQYKLRMPPELRNWLKEAADTNHRSMNAEIVARLLRTVELDGREKALERVGYEEKETMPNSDYRNLSEVKRQLEAAMSQLDRELRHLEASQQKGE
ncbi:Arc family DNA-binding protein [Halomonas sp. ATBC28]|uniref:Arc family DNA-binding protein n=1 Tax=Halomonas sp. ATBC28 TaxID=2545264 RepID=UPI00110DE556|nr:Arc family DNA-binding protein [Halomonas sp. ATBC28]TMU23169.1 Arc family DNA-binding protein [Halomonas sp. ATBC28]